MLDRIPMRIPTRTGGLIPRSGVEELEQRRLLSVAVAMRHEFGPADSHDGGNDMSAEESARRRGHGDTFVRTDLVSDGATPAAHTDPNLKNPWGIAFNPDGFWWVANNHSGTSTLYDSNGVLSPPGTPLVVSIPSPANPDGGGAPTGIVFSGGSGFVVSKGGKSGPSRFLFATEDGTIAGWAPNVDLTHAVIGADRSAGDASYKGLTLASTRSGDQLYAADFHNKRIDVFDDKFAPVHLSAGAFSDRRIPAEYSPFNVQNLGGKLFVAYAKLDAGGEDEEAGAGLGFVDEYDIRGRLLMRLAQHGPLNAPWGLAQAPDHFGRFSRDILVGNFGDGRIMAFSRNGHFDGYLRGTDHKPIEISGLWGIGFGNGKQAGPTDTLFFAAGTNDEENGLFGSLRLADNKRSDGHG